MNFIRIDKEIVEQARSTDMISFLENRHGFSFAHRGGVYRCSQHQSLAVKNDRLSWYWHSKGIGGFGTLDYLIKIENLKFHQAVKTAVQLPTSAPVIRKQANNNAFNLPEKAGIFLRLYDYLCHKRGIDTGIVSAMLSECKIYEDRRGNVVFVGYDDNEVAKFASLRGTNTNKNFRMDCAGSDKRYSFHMTYCLSEKLYIFESPIDAMSHASIENIVAENKNAWRQNNRLTLAGTSDKALVEYLKQHSHTKELVLCLDSDQAGRDASIVIARKYADKGYRTRIELPIAKDYNEDLKNILEKSKRKQVQLVI